MNPLGIDKGVNTKTAGILVSTMILSAVLVPVLWSSIATYGTELKQKATIPYYYDGCTLRFELDKTIYQIGESIVVRAFQRNNGTKPIQGGIWEYEAIIIDPFNRTLGSLVRSGELDPNFKVMPEQEIELEPLFSWSQRGSDRKQVIHGVYTFRIRVQLIRETVDLQFEIRGFPYKTHLVSSYCRYFAHYS